MGNTNSVPIISQTKSAFQWATGDSTGARETQNDFLFNNTFPGISQVVSAGYVIAGDREKALDLQKKFAGELGGVIDWTPGVGHIKGVVHYALGQNEQGHDAMKAASRTTGVFAGGIGGLAVGGPVGAVMGGIAGGAAMDGVITGSELVVHGPEKAKPHGYFAAAEKIAKAVNGKEKITAGEGFDMALLPVMDALTGYGAAEMAAKYKGLDTATGSKVNVPGEGLGPTAKNGLGLDKAALDNRANQMNPNHVKSGPGRPAGYQGLGTTADLNNHANQLNPNHVKSGPGRPAYQSLGTSADLNIHANQLSPNPVTVGPISRPARDHDLGTSADMYILASQMNNFIYQRGRDSPMMH